MFGSVSPSMATPDHDLHYNVLKMSAPVYIMGRTDYEAAYFV